MELLKRGASKQKNVHLRTEKKYISEPKKVHVRTKRGTSQNQKKVHLRTKKKVHLRTKKRYKHASVGDHKQKMGVRKTTIQETRTGWDGRSMFILVLPFLRAHVTDGGTLENIAIQPSFSWSLYYNQVKERVNSGLIPACPG